MTAKKILAAMAFTAAVACSAPVESPSDYVDPFIGTAFHGHTYPGATTPFGAVQLSPDNYYGVWDACSGYHYDRDTLTGFSHTHISGTGCADLGDILFVPATGGVSVNAEGITYPGLPYSHDAETASPGYYSVELPSMGVRAELTATTRSGWHRYTFPAGSTPLIVVDMEHGVTDEVLKASCLSQSAPATLEGMRITDGWVQGQRIYFSAQFSEDFNCTIRGNQAVLEFAPCDGERQIVAKVGLSINSIADAAANLAAETSAMGMAFDMAWATARASWDELLSCIRIQGANDTQLRTFYTALYHTAVAPNVISDAGERNYYSTLSLWDTFRAWLPLATIIYPDVIHDVALGVLDFYDKHGELPIWPLSDGDTRCMIGYHSAPFLLSAYAKGIAPELDTEHAIDAIRQSSKINGKGGAYYNTLGYIPADRSREAISCHLEYAYDDWTAARLAQLTGNESAYEEFTARALGYSKVFDGKTCFFRGLRSDLSWVEPFNSFEPGRDYTEATAWQYRFFVPQDFHGLEQLFGGREKFIAALDEMYDSEPVIDGELSDITGLIGQYAHGNEPSHHAAYIYNYCGQPWKTQAMTRRILDEMYGDRPEDICGNEDCGQMSAWYVMSALGLYEVCPGSCEYSLTTPLFPLAQLDLPNGKTLTIKADGAASKKYVKSVSLNGRIIERNYITHDELLEGGVLEFVLSRRPCKDRGTDPQAAPFSISSGLKVSTPYYDAGDQLVSLFTECLDLELGCRTEGATIYYTLDGSTPDASSTLYEGTLHLTDNTLVQAIAIKDGYADSEIMSVNVTKAVLFEPIAGEGSVPGVSYSYYHGDFDLTSEIDGPKGSLVASGTLDRPRIDGADREDYFGYKFKGLILVPESGLWTFVLNTDDGSVLRVDGNLVVSNDGGHALTSQSGTILLEKGLHRYEIDYFESYEGQDFQWYWRSPSEAKAVPVPSENLFVM